MVNPIRKSASFSEYIFEAWDRVDRSGGEYFIPFSSVPIADLFRKELYAFRVSLEAEQPERFYAMKRIKILLVKPHDIELPCGELDPERHSVVMVMIDDDKIYGQALRDAELINPPPSH